MLRWLGGHHPVAGDWLAPIPTAFPFEALKSLPWLALPKSGLIMALNGSGLFLALPCARLSLSKRFNVIIIGNLKGVQGRSTQHIVNVKATGFVCTVYSLQDYWHHWEDVLAGFLLGLFIAYLCYRQHFHALLGPKSGDAYAGSHPENQGTSLHNRLLPC